MEFFIKMNPKAKDYLQPGSELKMTFGGRPTWVTITRFEEDKIFIKAEGEDERHLQNLFEKRVKEFNAKN